MCPPLSGPLSAARLWVATLAKARERRAPRSGDAAADKSLGFYSQFVKKNDLCFDIGANVGNRTEMFRQLGAKVICVEPQEGCLETLTRQFGGDPEVIIVGKAVGDREGEGEIAICRDAPTISTMSEKWRCEGRFAQDFAWPETQRIAITTLDRLTETYGMPDFCKIDVEGFEPSVIRGMTKPIPALAFEFTREFFSDAVDCLWQLEALGYRQFNASLWESMELLSPKWMDWEALVRRLETSDDALLWGDFYARHAHWGRR